MTRDFLKGLGLEDDVIDKVMADYGKSVNALKSERDDLAKKVESFDGVLSERDKLKADLEGMTSRADKAEKDFSDFKNSLVLDKALEAAGFRSVDDAKKLINLDDLSYEGDSVKGLDDVVRSLRESSSYLFKDDSSDNGSSDGAKGMTSHVPERSSGDNKSALESQIEAIFND